LYRKETYCNVKRLTKRKRDLLGSARKGDLLKRDLLQLLKRDLLQKGPGNSTSDTYTTDVVPSESEKKKETEKQRKEKRKLNV
jgi:hypothetical protein